MDCIKTAECIDEILSLSARLVILDFRHQGLLHKSDGFTLNSGTEYKGDSIFSNYDPKQVSSLSANEEHRSTKGRHMHCLTVCL